MICDFVDRWGALHGLQTFLQLVACSAEPSGLAVAGAPWAIADAPRFPHRGLLLDTSRHFLPVPALLRSLDAMAASKLNVLHWHIVDAQSFPFGSEAVPSLPTHGAYPSRRGRLTYSLKDVAAVAAHAEARGIRVLPEFDAPGHAYAWGGLNSGPHAPSALTVCAAAEPWATYCAEPPCGQLDATHEGVYTMLAKLLPEAARAFMPPSVRAAGAPARDIWFHAGGDEVNNACYLDTPHVKAWMAAHNASSPADGVTKLLQYFHDRERQVLSRVAGTVIQWEGTWTAGVVLDPGTTVIQAWLPGSLARAAAAGFRVINSEAATYYLDCGFGGWIGPGQSWCPPYKSWYDIWSVDPAANLTNADTRGRLLGGEAALWGEMTDDSNLDNKAWPRAAAAAERFWSPPLEGWAKGGGPGSEAAGDALTRLVAHRARLVARHGVRAAPLQPTYCTLGGGNVNCPWTTGPTN